MNALTEPVGVYLANVALVVGTTALVVLVISGIVGAALTGDSDSSEGRKAAYRLAAISAIVAGLAVTAGLLLAMAQPWTPVAS